MFGDLWCDTTGLRSNGLPPQAYSRDMPMSDKMQSMLMNPFYLPDSVELWLQSSSFKHIGFGFYKLHVQRWTLIVCFCDMCP